MIVLLLLGLSGPSWAGPQEDAQRLKDEATAYLKANSGRAADPEQYAQCIIKLEQAQALLESAKTDNNLTQEVCAALFWARRMADFDVSKALDRLRKGGAATAVPRAAIRRLSRRFRHHPLRLPLLPRRYRLKRNPTPTRPRGADPIGSGAQSVRRGRDLR